MAQFTVNTPQEREALMAAITAAIDYNNDTLTGDLFLSDDESSLGKKELSDIRTEIDDKVDRLMDLVRLQERLTLMVV